MIQASIDLIDRDSEMKKITAGSHSRLTVFESCKARANFAYVQFIKEPPRPLPPGKTEHANDRGTRIHFAAEKFVQGGVELIPELQAFAPEMHQLRTMYAQGLVSLEGEWAFDAKWEPVAWRSSNAWMRIKTDVIAFTSLTSAVVIDYKTGKRWGNEVKHAEQAQLYQLGAFIRYPKLKKVRVELWYTDRDELHPMEYRRDQGLRFAAGIEKRMLRMTEEEDFPPNPNAHTCRFCPYKPTELGGTGHCSVGV